MGGGEDETSCFDGYPVISFGPGQGYISKGCNLVSLAKGRNQKPEVESDRLIY